MKEIRIKITKEIWGQETARVVTAVGREFFSAKGSRSPADHTSLGMTIELNSLNTLQVTISPKTGVRGKTEN